MGAMPGMADAQPIPPPEQLPAPVKMTGIGNSHIAIKASPEAQAWFDQGLSLLHDFWEYESAKAFEQGIRVDPNCAMCYWGLAKEQYVTSPSMYFVQLRIAAVRHAYYDGLPGNFSFTMALSAWGWHAETAIHTLRLVLSGALDRHPGLKIVIGHMGEALPFMLDRIDETTAAAAKTHLRRSVRQTILDQVWITTSGFFTMVPFMAALMTFGVDRIMFSIDYPFASNARARAFLDTLPVSPADLAKIAHGNADRLPAVAGDDGGRRVRPVAGLLRATSQRGMGANMRAHPASGAVFDSVNPTYGDAAFGHHTSGYLQVAFVPGHDSGPLFQ